MRSKKVKKTNAWRRTWTGRGLAMVNQVENQPVNERINRVVTIHRQTEKSWLISLEGKTYKFFVPKKLCDITHTKEELGDVTTMLIPKWLILKNEL